METRDKNINNAQSGEKKTPDPDVEKLLIHTEINRPTMSVPNATKVEQTLRPSKKKNILWTLLILLCICVAGFFYFILQIQQKNNNLNSKEQVTEKQLINNTDTDSSKAEKELQLILQNKPEYFDKFKIIDSKEKDESFLPKDFQEFYKTASSGVNVYEVNYAQDFSGLKISYSIVFDPAARINGKVLETYQFWAQQVLEKEGWTVISGTRAKFYAFLYAKKDSSQILVKTSMNTNSEPKGGVELFLIK